MVTTEGILSPREALEIASRSARSTRSVSTWRRRLPEAIPTAAKDLRRVRDNRRFRSEPRPAPWHAPSVRFVMQLHELCSDAGLRLAEQLSVPSVLFVEACQVAEARTWGVERPGWSRLAEHFGERPQLRRADVVVCVSEEVAASVERCAARTSGVVVVPNGVDATLFSPGAGDAELRARLGLDDRFVVGWSGSFRSFHGLDLLVDAAARARRDITNLALLLVGDGLVRASIERRAGDLGVPACFPGTVPYHQMPEYLRLMNVAVVPAPSSVDFHYSPMKLREFQAVGLPIVAADVGQMGRSLRDGLDAVLVPPGDTDALARALTTLHADRALESQLGSRARDEVVESGSWSSRLDVLEQSLSELGAR